MTDTPNYGLKRPDFDVSTWHDDINNNFTIIDAFLKSFTGALNFQGIWALSTAYTVGQILTDELTGELYSCAVVHNSASSSTFAADRLANPTYWATATVHNQVVLEGTFLPELWDSTLATDASPPTYALQVGKFIKIGKQVTFHITLSVSGGYAGLTPGDDAVIGALPYVSSADTVDFTVSMTLPITRTDINDGEWLGLIGANVDYISLGDFANITKIITDTCTGTSIGDFTIVISGTYFTDS